LENQRFRGFLFFIFLLFTPLGENLGKIVAKNHTHLHRVTTHHQ